MTKRTTQSAWLGYAVAVLGTAAAAALRWMLVEMSGPEIPPYITFYPIITVSALVGGTWPGVVATVLSALAVDYLFLEPTPALGMEKPGDIAGFIIFIAVNLMLCAVCSRMRGLRLRSEASADAARKATIEWERTFDTMPDLVAIIDKEHRIVRANRAMAERLKTTPAACVGLTCFQCMHGTEGPPAECPHEQTLRDLREHTMEMHEPQLNGDFLITTTPMFDDRDRMIGTVHVARDVGERRRAEEALRESEGRLRANFDNAAMGIVETDDQDHFIAINRRACQMLGYAAEELAGKSVHELTAPEDRSESDRLNADLREGRRDILDYEKRYLRRDGSPLWVHVTVSTVRDAQGRLLHKIGTFEDITERKRADEALRQTLDWLARTNAELEQAMVELQAAKEELTQQNEALVASQATLEDERSRYAALFDFAPDGYLVSDLNGRIAEANLAACRLLGVDRSFLIRHPLLTFVAGDNLEKFEGLLVRFRAGHAQESEFLELSIQPRGRPALPCAVAVNVIKDAEGALTGLRWLVRDITERKRVEEAVQEQARLATLRADMVQMLQQPAPTRDLLQDVARLVVERLDAAFARVWLVDAAGQTLELKASAGLYTNLTGSRSRVAVGEATKIGRIAFERRSYVTNEVIGDPLVPQQDWARREGLVAFVGWPLVLEDRLLGVAASFARHPFSQAAAETFGAVAGIVSQFLGRRQAEETLAQVNRGLENIVEDRTEALRKSVEELEHFSYSITHDMRAPLRAMRSYATLLLRSDRARLPGEEKDWLQNIAASAERMDHLIVDALDYAKAVREKLPLANVDVDSLVRGMLQSYPTFHAVMAKIHIEGTLPPVVGNKAGLTQCFSNLLNNAVKFVQPGTMPQVRVRAEQQGARVRLWVEDKGIGIAKEHQERIFDMFQRLSDDKEGTGIGLALVKKVAEKMNGRVGVESDPGQGSRFWMELDAASGERRSETAATGEAAREEAA